MSIKNIFTEITSFNNILLAEQNVRAGSRYDKEELAFWKEYEDNLHYISESMQNLNFPPDTYRSFYVYEPKLRKIVCSDYTTKVIQRAVYNTLNPLVCKGFITDTYSCVKGRGQLSAMFRLSEWINYVNSSGKQWYYCKNG